MSGLVAILSRDPHALGRGPGALARLRHLESYDVVETRAAAAYVGVCGRPREISLADEGGEAALAAVAGEILNGTALSRELGLASGASPASVALAAYLRWGEGLFRHLEGNFALLVHDARRGRTLAGPDSYGVTYLHTLRLGDDVFIATEVKALLADPRFRPRLDPEAASCVVALGHEFGRGLFAGVEAVPQGHHVVVEGGAVRMVRHWDARDAVGSLRGRDYIERLRAASEELAAEAFAGGRSLLPLTGGLDSRLLAAARPAGADVHAVTFGCMADSDCLRGSQIARVCGMPHQAIPFETDYVARHAASTVWLSEGRLTPAENTTGLQMPGLAAYGRFVSGMDCGVGRRFSKAKTFFPDWSLVGPDTPALAAWLRLRFSRSGMSPAEAETAFGARAAEARAPGIGALDRFLDETRGFRGVDRIDLYYVGGRSRGWRTSGLGVAGVWIAARAPFFTRRWIDAVLAGAPEERLDDRPRLNLIREFDPVVAGVPWVMTRMPLRESAYVLHAFNDVSRLRRAGASRRAPSARSQATTKRYMALVKGVYHRFYTYADHREVWLRGASRGYVEEVLLSDRFGARGFADPRGVRRLVGEHMAGRDHTLAISILLGLELWSRQFVDGDSPPALPEAPTRLL